MSKRRSGEHAGHTYRCWLEAGQGRYRGWYRGKLNLALGDKHFIDRLHSHTDWLDTPEAALDEAELRVKSVIEEVAAATQSEL